MTGSDVLAATTERTLVLRDGRSVRVRPLTADDGAALMAAVERADPWDLRKRFLGPPPPAHVLAKQLGRLDGDHDAALGAFADDGRLVAVAQFDRADDRPVAEVAVEVAHDWQQTGLGTAIVGQLAGLARAHGIHEFTATYFADNLPIRRLLRNIGAVLASRIDHGEGEARISLDPVR